MRRRLVYAALAVPLYCGIPMAIGILGRDLAAKTPARFPTAEPAVVLRFQNHYGPYFRHLFGCPDTATDPAECRPARAWQDTLEWRQARELAKQVFDLHD